MKKFDKIIWETYKVLLEQDPNLEMPAVQPVDDLGAAAPVDDLEDPAAGEDAAPERLSSAAEVNLVKIIRYALFTSIPAGDFDELDSSIPPAESINESNAKSSLEQIKTVLKTYSQDFAAMETTASGIVDQGSDEAIMSNLPPV